MPAERALPSFVWIENWPWGMREACVIHWSGKQGAAGDGAGCTAWSGGARSPACSAWAPSWVTGYDDSCKRKRRSGRGSPGVESDGGATQTSRRRAQAEVHGRSSGRRRCDGAPSVGSPGFDSWTHQDPSTVALVGWRVVERRFCAGAGPRRGGARRSGMEAALGFMAARVDGRGAGVRIPFIGRRT